MPQPRKHADDRARMRSWYSSAANRKRQAARARERVYGLSPEATVALLEAQDGRCALCSVELVEVVERGEPTLTRMAVDHCHETGRVRGLVCTSCNSRLRNYGDTPEALAKASLEARERSAWLDAALTYAEAVRV